MLLVVEAAGKGFEAAEGVGAQDPEAAVGEEGFGGGQHGDDGTESEGYVGEALLGGASGAPAEEHGYGRRQGDGCHLQYERFAFVALAAASVGGQLTVEFLMEPGELG
jgi:hypothetical protein